jgi:hypothetical protein
MTHRRRSIDEDCSGRAKGLEAGATIASSVDRIG